MAHRVLFLRHQARADTMRRCTHPLHRRGHQRAEPYGNIQTDNSSNWVHYSCHSYLGLDDAILYSSRSQP